MVFHTFHLEIAKLPMSLQSPTSKSISFSNFRCRSILALLGCIALVVSTGCNSASTDNKKVVQGDPIQIGLALGDSSDETIKTITSTVESHQKRNRTKYVISKGAGDSVADQINDLLEQDVKAIVMIPGDESTLEACKKAIEKDIKVISILNQFDSKLLSESGVTIPFCGASQKVMASDLAERTLMGIPENSEVAILACDGEVATEERAEGYKSVFDAKKMKLVSSGSVAPDREKAKAAIGELLKKHPNLKAVYFGHENIVLGAIDYVADTKAKFRICGFGEEGVLVRQRQNSLLTAIVDTPPATEIGIYGIGLTMDILSGKQTEGNMIDVNVLTGQKFDMEFPAEKVE